MTTDIAVGKPTPLLDGRAKVTGTMRFAGDLNLPGVLYAKFLASPYAHANIRAIDTTAARAMSGVTAVLTAHDLPDIAPSGRTRLLLARNRVIFVGQPVAVVLATSEAAAEDALEHIVVDYEPLPTAITMDEALASNAPLVWPNGIPDGNADAVMHGAASGGEEIAADPQTNLATETLMNAAILKRDLPMLRLW